MIVLGIETSCDETAAAVVKLAGGKLTVLSQVVASQAKLHAKFGGVVPEVAARKQVEAMIPVLAEAKINPKKIDAIAVTKGPGLVTSLGVGVETAKALSIAWQKPLIPVNHVLAHLYSVWPSNPSLVKNEKKFLPAMGLIVSGGHTELLIIYSHNKYKLIGRTIDDAAGEALDKSARLLDLPYPGGAALEKLALKSKANKIIFPKPLSNTNSFDFSFSGLKTAIRYEIEKNPAIGQRRFDVAAAVQASVTEFLCRRLTQALKKFKVKSIMIGGGVTANNYLRQNLQNIAYEHKLPLLLPQHEWTGDNAVMIATLGLMQFNTTSKTEAKKYLTAWKNLVAEPNWELK